ncbi:transcription termination factor MTERF8, chloroplastic [Malania oleifera]|uniref:transcription termination factor MTERF8, chloroplastic n=1 Tax=Malania oleifera TaxID=397392 RepID=UPI0025ADB134|nr:transcription termination factor MTERF8, chloroplastic [Malania oleifera]
MYIIITKKIVFPFGERKEICEMDTLLTTFPHPFPPSSSFSSSAVQVQFAVVLHPALQPRDWFSVMKLSPTRSTAQLSPLLAQLGSNSSGDLVAQHSTNSPSNLVSVSEKGTFLLLTHELGLDESEAQLLLNTNASLRFTSFESLRIRTDSLLSLGINGLALGRLVAKRPDVLIAEEINPLLRFIRDDLEGKIEALQLQRLLTATDPRFLVGFEDKVRLLLHHGVPREKLVRVLNNVSLTKAICLKPAEEIERTMAFLSRFGGTDLIVRRPAILNYDLDRQLIPRIRFLMELSGGDEDATAAVVRRLPAVLSYSVEHLGSHVEFFRSFAGLTEEEIFRILLVFPNLMSASKERKLHPRIDFLKQCGLDSTGIFKFLSKAPLFLGLSFEGNLAYKLNFLVKIGYAYRTKDMTVAMWAMTRTSCENLQKVIGVFLSYGLSCEDIFIMSKKHPQILQYNHSSLEEKMEYLIEDMGREVGELLVFPAFLGYKLDDRIKRRYEERKKIVGEGMSLNKLLSVSTERFIEEEKKKQKAALPV